MLTTLFPKACHAHSSLPLLGSIADNFDDWLLDRCYKVTSRTNAIEMLHHIDSDLRRRGIKHITRLTHGILHRSWRALIPRFPTWACTVRVLERYLKTRGLLDEDDKAEPCSKIDVQITAYADYLQEVRGCAQGRIVAHKLIAKCFLRYLPSQKRIPSGLDSQIDTPRLYRLEHLPRSLPWETVRAFLQSIDRTTDMGLRDYTIFLLIATYGLRVSEAVALTLEGIQWRANTIKVFQPKASTLLELPLTNEVGTALLKYLKRVPPRPLYRQIFLRMRAPIGPLTPDAVKRAFRSWSPRSD